MVATPRTIRVDPDSELGRALSQNDHVPVVLETVDGTFTVTRAEADPWANYDPLLVVETLKEFAGTFTPEDGERMKERVYRGREEGTRPIGTRPFERR